MKTSGIGAKRLYATTHWSVVLAASGTGGPHAQEALEKLCGTYWYPLYAYVRRQGHSPEDAQDLTQEFFARFLEKKYFRLANRERGRFRTFLLSSLKNFLVNEWNRSRAAKRGGGTIHIPIDGLTAENHYNQEPAHNLNAEKIYERNWAMAVLEQVRARLQEEYASGKPERFAQLESFLPGEESDLTYAEAGRRYGMAEGTLKSDVNRFKKRYRELLRAEVAHTVANPAELEEELRHLIKVLGES
jgi:RNA polymerase sigma factor (sigma-70 family)